MIRIVDFSVQVDYYRVVDDADGRQLNATSVQVASALLNGVEIANAELTKKGFKVQDYDGAWVLVRVKYNEQAAARAAAIVEAKHGRKKAAARAEMYERELRMRQQEQALREQQRLKELERQQRIEEQKKILEEQARRINQQKGARPKVQAKPVPIGEKKSATTIMFKGRTYISAMSLCREYNRDYKTFKSLRERGYSIAESLGLETLRTEEQLKESYKANSINNVLDRMAKERQEI